MSSELQIRNTVPCPFCGTTDFEWGFARERYQISYMKGVNSLLRVFQTGTELTARRCLKCGCVQLFHPESRS